MGVVSAIPNEWRSTIKGKSVHVDPHPFIEDSFKVPIRCEMFDLSSVSSKTLYREFRSRKEIPPTAQAKFKEEYPIFSTDWKEIYLLAFNVTLDTNLRAFQYKLLNRIIFTNDKQYGRCHFVSFAMYITGAKFEDHCSNISVDILNSVFYRFS